MKIADFEKAVAISILFLLPFPLHAVELYTASETEITAWDPSTATALNKYPSTTWNGFAAGGGYTYSYYWPNDGTIEMRDGATGNLERTWSAGDTHIGFLAADGTYLYTASETLVTRWDPTSGTSLNSYAATTWNGFTAGGGYTYSYYWPNDGVIEMRDITNGDLVRSWSTGQTHIEFLAIDGDYLYTATETLITRWDPFTATELNSYAATTWNGFAAGDGYTYSYYWPNGGTVEMRDGSTGDLVRTWSAGDEYITYLAVDQARVPGPGGLWLLAAGLLAMRLPSGQISARSQSA